MSLGVFRFLENMKIVLSGSFQGFQDTFYKNFVENIALLYRFLFVKKILNASRTSSNNVEG